MTEKQVATTEKEASVLKLLLKSGKVINSEVELEKLVQTVTDISTELTGAAFGGFFYNAENQAGEKYVLYTISGAPKEAFSKFPMPRNTDIFNPTFTGQGIRRYDDVTQQPHYGKMAPHYGMPKGHLPVRSYLAAPVISSITGEVIGGLFFGHPEPGVFNDESEILVEGMAAQAATAMANAKLFEEKKNTEQKLRQTSLQYKSIFESTFDAIIILDMEGFVVETNNAAVKLFGYPAASGMTGISGKSLLSGDPAFESVQHVVKAGRVFSSEGFIRNMQGGALKVEMNVSAFAYGDQPHMLAVFSQLPDAASRRTIEDIQTFAEVLTSASPVALWMTDEVGQTNFVNQTWVDWTGKPFDHHLNSKWFDYMVAEDRERVKEQFRASFAKKKLFESEYRVIRSDGTVIWVIANGNPFYSREGTFRGYAGSCMDITDRKRIQGKLESQIVLINTIANNTLHALFMLDDRQYCTYMNPAAEEMTGYKLSEMHEKPLHYYIHHTHPDGRHYPIEECPIDRALPERMQSRGEDVFIHKDGHFYYVSFIASPIIENGKPKGTVIEVRDITQEKLRAEELKRKEEFAKEMLEQKVKERTSELEKMNYELLQFTSVASHDLKEPLRKISIFSRMVRDRSEELVSDPTSKKYIDQIVQSSSRMTRLIEDLLVFSRLSQDTHEFHPVNLNTLITEIISDLEISITEKKAKIEWDGLPVVKGIALHLGQVFQNLISNSLKFAHPERRPEIRITGETIDRNGKICHRIVYNDNGIGFDNQYAEKIFAIFQRLHTKEKYEGTGVGLAIVKKIVDLHKGEIRAHAIEGVGSTFEILFPGE